MTGRADGEDAVEGSGDSRGGAEAAGVGEPGVREPVDSKVVLHALGDGGVDVRKPGTGDDGTLGPEGRKDGEDARSGPSWVCRVRRVASCMGATPRPISRNLEESSCSRSLSQSAHALPSPFLPPAAPAPEQTHSGMETPSWCRKGASNWCISPTGLGSESPPMRDTNPMRALRSLPTPAASAAAVGVVGVMGEGNPCAGPGDDRGGAVTEFRQRRGAVERFPWESSVARRRRAGEVLGFVESCSRWEGSVQSEADSVGVQYSRIRQSSVGVSRREKPGDFQGEP